MSDLERSKLVQKHRDALAVIEKDIKKKKGAYRDAAQKKYDELKETQDAELAEFDRKRAGGGTSAVSPATAADDASPVAAVAKSSASASSDASKNAAAAPAAAAPADEKPKRVKRFSVHNWSTCGRSELDEYCKARGLSAKGKKEDLVMRLTTFTLEQQQGFASGELIPDDAEEKSKKTKAASNNNNNNNDDDDDEDEDDDDDDDDDDDEEGEGDDDDGEHSAEWTEAEKEERARLYKRRLVVTGAIFRLLKKHPLGIELNELSTLLEGAGELQIKIKIEIVIGRVKNFRPELVGYKTAEEFLKKESGQYFRFVDGAIKPR